jgi:hypothetical protein
VGIVLLGRVEKDSEDKEYDSRTASVQPRLGDAEAVAELDAVAMDAARRE